jgi:TRAP-type C4-dicarboxylate transport system permease large subunit
VLILGGMRAGWFTPTEAAVVAVFYGLFVGMVSTARSACATCSPSCATRASCRR